MARDAPSPFRRYREDPRDLRRQQLQRLEQLGVSFVELAPARACALFTRFLDAFIDPERAAELRLLLDASGAAGRATELARWLRPDRTQRGGPLGCARWLAKGEAPARCVRFERHAYLPALEIDLATLDDAWAGSWPGVFVSFDAGRAVVVTLDYEDLRCDVRAAPATPYR